MKLFDESYSGLEKSILCAAAAAINICGGISLWGIWTILTGPPIPPLAPFLVIAAAGAVLTITFWSRAASA